MPGFVFLSRKVELLGVKIIFLRNVLPVLNFSKDETFLKENWSNRQRKKFTVNTIPLQTYSIFFFALYKLTWDVASSFPFSLKGERKRFLFYDQSFFVISPIKSIPFHSTSFHGITCGRGSFAVLYSTGFIVESPLSQRHLVSGLFPLHMLNQVPWFGVHFESVQRFQTCFFGSLEIVLILCFLIASQDILRL